MRISVPPVAQTIIAGALMWLIHRVDLGPALAFSGQRLVAAGFVLAGFLIGAAAVAAFVKQKTTVNPMAPESASKLVTDGLFRISRNPMYLAMLLLLIGWAVWLGDIATVPPLIGFVWFMTAFQIKPEEEALREKFGEAYADYCRRTRRWI